jgi:hypothetical protein
VSPLWQWVFHTAHGLALQPDLDDGVDQIPLSRVLKRGLEKSSLQGGYNVRNQDNEARMDLDFAKELDGSPPGYW